MKIKSRQLNKGSIVSARYSNDFSPESLPPYFSLRYLSDNYCISKCDKDDKAAFADTLRKLSKLTWTQIKSSHRHGLGFETIQKDQIRSSIPNHITEDVRFIAFRFSGKKAMVGYRERATFYVIWFDRDFSLYPHS
jgi:hypothetical protein